jgi:DNA repair ATPase RecN
MAQLSRSWARRSRASASAALKAELKTDQSYARLRDQAVASARRKVATADVKGVDDLIIKVKRTDESLGQKRAGDIDALLAHLGAQLDAARRLRLARDQWALRSKDLLAYRDQAEQVVAAFERLRQPLAEIRALSGPEPRSLKKLRQRIANESHQLSLIVPPPEVASLHAMLVSACHLAGRAVDTREKAILSQDLRLAWDASAAASGSTMLMIQAWTDMQPLFKPPELR